MKSFLLLLLVAASLALNTPLWTAKNVAHDKLDMRVPVNITEICYLQDRTPNLIATGTASGHMRLYDTNAQRKPILDKEISKFQMTRMIGTKDGNSIFCADTRGKVLQNITGVTNAAISGDAQWVITLNESGISTYTRKTSVWVAAQTLPLPSQTSFGEYVRLLVNTDASRFSIAVYGGTSRTFYLYSRSSGTNVFSLFWTLTSNIMLSQDLSTAFQLNFALKGVNVTKLDWTKKQLVPSGFVPVTAKLAFSAVSADGSSFIVNDEVLARNSSRGWITNDIASDDVVTYAFSGDNVFLFQATPGGVRRYLLTDTTSTYLPYDVCCIRGVQRGYYCYLPGSKSKPDNYSINITRHEVDIEFASANTMDCFAAGSSPIYQVIDSYNRIAANNTNVTIAIFDDKGNVSLIQVGLVSAASKTVIIDLMNNQTQVQVWLTSVCLNPAATSDVQVLSFSLPVDTTTSADTTKSTKIRSSTYSSASTLGMGSAVIMTLVSLLF
ncbi:WD repeat-containing protein [Planoprotostelium fungivorum]|uniref:WD repeat-containing protein n=1 Tax=Planoprotostelium fungivorum TaxID=1890364 RepID=A0A2P6NAQ4_9EUKA|nr:WD repeat-containing protein [Planoprotostelium fungivorum]